MDEASHKSMMRQALSPDKELSRTALQALTERTEQVPPSFVPLLISRAVRANNHFLHLTSKIVSRAVPNGAEIHTKKRLTSIASGLRKSRPSTRHAVNIIKLSSAFLALPEVRQEALDLLVVSVACLEGSAVGNSGPQRRSRQKSLRVAYRFGGRAVRGSIESVRVALFKTADQYAKAPMEAVAAIGLLAPSFDFLEEKEQEQYLVLVGTICMKASSAAENVSRVSLEILSRANRDIMLAKVIPLIDKAVLREPQAALPASVHFLSGIGMMDISSAPGKSIVSSVARAVRSPDENSRSLGIKLASALGNCMEQEGTILDAIAVFCADLKNARYAYQKVAAFDAMSDLICARSRSNAVYEQAITQLHVWLSSKKETNEDARRTALRAMVKIFSLAVVGVECVADLCEYQKSCASFLTTVLSGQTSEIDQKALLTVMTEDLPRVMVSERLLDLAARSALETIITSATTKQKHEQLLRSFAIMSVWDLEGAGKMESSQYSRVWAIAARPDSSPVFQDPVSFGSMSEACCAIQCCAWIVREGHESLEDALGALFKHCLDDRRQVATSALREVGRIQGSGDGDLISKMFSVFWNTQFNGEIAESSLAKDYYFDDGMCFAERLGRVLLRAALPNVPRELIPKILLASNHPRLVRTPSFGCPLSSSRFWHAVSRHLEEVDTSTNSDVDDDWLELCLQEIFGQDGLRSSSSTTRVAAVNSLCALADAQMPYSTRVLRRSVVLLRSFALKAANLDSEDFEALGLVKEAENLKTSMKGGARHHGGSNPKKHGKKQVAASNPRLNQQKQAEADRARAAAANASAVAEKAEAAKDRAEAAAESLHLASQALVAITALAGVAPVGVHTLMATMLSLVLPLAGLEELEDPCRQALCGLANTSKTKIHSIALEVAGTLYGLERNWDVFPAVSSIIISLKGLVPPALCAEDFALVAPVIKAAMLRDPQAEDQGINSGRRGSTKRRDTIAVVKAASQVLLEHCKPEAVDAAVAAAGCHAGAWAVRVLEREDGAFAAAADALALLAGTALNPGTSSLSQVLGGIISGRSSVRDAALGALARIPPLFIPTMECPRDSMLGRSIWLARFDPDEANAELADELWSNYKHPLHVSEDVPALLSLLEHKESDIRLMAAKAIASALCGSENESTRNVCIPQMFTMYFKKMPNPSIENGSRPDVRKGIKRGHDRRMTDQELGDEGWTAREGVGLTIENMAGTGALTPKDITVSFSFLAGRGLGDGHDNVRAQMSKAAIAVVEAAGTLGPSVLLPMIEKQLNTSLPPTASKDDVLHADRTRENLVTCLGSVAGFLPPDDPRVGKIANQVIKSAMETPSEVVQNAAARCIVPLARAAVDNGREEEVTRTLLDQVWSESSTYGQRRGAAYAMAGISKGLGLKFVKRHSIMGEIEIAVADKNPRRRQGAFLLIETNALLLERLFEPFAVETIPFLLSCMGDTVVEVRNACWAAAQASMSEISSQGVKMILPSLLAGLKDRQWRTKAGSAEVLGAMAFCAPRQLAQCLPQVVPKLAEALADAHPKVVYAAESAINRIAAVVRSPEVRKLSPFLLAALRDPAGRTRGAIDAMLGSEFVHAIDAASLALLIPPLHRGLRDRSSELKKRSAAIVGSMCNNVANRFDVVPYLDLLLPSLQITLLDAIPDVRRTSARALGSLAVSLGEQGLPDIVPWLVNAVLGGVVPAVKVTGDRPKVSAAVVTSSAERSGAAMGLAEVAASMSDRRMEDVLNSVLRAGQTSAEAREGGLMLIAAMPRSLGERFEGRLAKALASTLQGLADDADSVREAALDAGRNLVSAYAKSSLEHLLPEILRAMREKLWRIRQAATHLLGDMLLVIAGALPERPDLFGSTDSAGNDTDPKKENEEDAEENGERNSDSDSEKEEEFESPEHAAAAMTTEMAMKEIEAVLGTARRNEVLAALYIIRCDVSIRVRQTGLQVWKSVVANTPRVLREIMPSAVRQIVDGLGDEDEERRAAAGKTLSDLAQKLGDRVVPEVLPALKLGLSNKENSNRIRRGACEGLGELVLACSKDQLEGHTEELIGAVLNGLTDEVSSVRSNAADVFASLLRPLGTLAVDSVIPPLIEGLSGDSGSGLDPDIALDSLKEILRSSGIKLTNIVVPRLLSERPLKIGNSRALATAASVAEGAFEPHIVDVVDAVVNSIETLATGDRIEHLDAILVAISHGGEQSVKDMLDEIYSKFNEGYPERRVAASRACAGYIREAPVETVTGTAASLLGMLIRQLADNDEDAARSALEALKLLSDVVPNSALSAHIPVIRESLRAASSGISVTDPTAKITALQMPKSPAPFVPIVSDGLLNGAPELREQAALAIGELVEMTNPKSLGPFVIKLAGPLIRVVSGRFPWQVKAAILKSLLLLLNNGSVMLRSFAPQLQSTFVKSLSDSSRLVRARACAALGALVPIQMRLEPLLNDLVALGHNGALSGSRAAAFHACSQVFKLGKKLPESSFTSLLERITEGLADDDADVSKAAGRSLGFLASRSSSAEQYISVLEKVWERFGGTGVEYTERVCAIRAMGAVFGAGKNIKGLLYDDVEVYANAVFSMFSSSIPQLQCAACAAAGDIFVMILKCNGMSSLCISQQREIVLKLSERAEFDDVAEVRVAALNAIKDIVREDVLVLETCSPTLVACSTATNTAVRESADRVMRRAFVRRDLDIDQTRYGVARSVLEEEDQDFLERRLPKLRELPASDDERD